MHSIRTGISIFEKKEFEAFLKKNGLKDLLIGEYEYGAGLIVPKPRICYAYSDQDKELVEQLTFFKLKYGGLEEAYFLHLINGLEEYDY